MVDAIKYCKFSRILIDKDSIVYSDKIGEWCRKPYLGHPNGCPNYGKNPLCPPNSKFMKNDIEKCKYHYLYYIKFDFKKYREEYYNLRPDLTEKQISCCIYYQNQIKAYFYRKIDSVYNNKMNLLMGCGSGFGKNLQSMESSGINVVVTLRHNGIPIEFPPKNIITFCALLCSNNEK